MGGYVQAKAGPARQGGDGVLERRTAAAGAGPAASADGGVLNQSPPARSLLQLRRRLDAAPAVRSQLALQRALDRSVAKPAAPPKRLKKPPLQMKRVAIETLQRMDDPPATRRSAPPEVIQKAAVELVSPRGSTDGPAAPDASSRVIQAVEVAVARQIPQHSEVSEELLQTAIEAIKEIVEQVEKSEGNAKSGPEHDRLAKILENETLASKLPQTSNATFGLGGSNYFGDAPFTTTQGTTAFGNAVSSLPDIGSTEHLGARATGMHDEMHHISEYPGLQALASSQGHCFFCFGTVHGRGYEHGALRGSDPWPQDWQHDYLGFKLKRTSERMDAIEHTFDPVLRITAEKYGTRYYYVSKA